MVRRVRPAQWPAIPQVNAFTYAYKAASWSRDARTANRRKGNAAEDPRVHAHRNVLDQQGVHLRRTRINDSSLRCHSRNSRSIPRSLDPSSGRGICYLQRAEETPGTPTRRFDSFGAFSKLELRAYSPSISLSLSL